MSLRVLGLAPVGAFSGFERSFFDALARQGVDIVAEDVESPWFKALTTLGTIHPNMKRWATRRDREYHASVLAFKLKSRQARRIVTRHSHDIEAIYQIGSLWNPCEAMRCPPLVLQVDYTSMLSERRGGEWCRRPGREREFWLRQERTLYNRSKIVLTTTANARRSLIDDYCVPEQKVVTVGAGVSAPYDRIEEQRKPSYASQRVLFVGKGLHGKGLDTLLLAWPLVKQWVPGAILTVVGPTQLTVDVAGVDYRGRIASREEVRDLYFQHSVFAMPSRVEPLGQVFLEAMSCGLACIGANVDAMPELIDDGVTGYVVPVGDVKVLSERLVYLLRNPDLATAFGQAGLRRLKENYTWEIVGAKIVEQIRMRVVGGAAASDATAS